MSQNHEHFGNGRHPIGKLHFEFTVLGEVLLGRAGGERHNLGRSGIGASKRAGKLQRDPPHRRLGELDALRTVEDGEFAFGDRCRIVVQVDFIAFAALLHAPGSASEVDQFGDFYGGGPLECEIGFACAGISGKTPGMTDVVASALIGDHAIDSELSQVLRIKFYTGRGLGL